MTCSTFVIIGQFVSLALIYLYADDFAGGFKSAQRVFQILNGEPGIDVNNK